MKKRVAAVTTSRSRNRVKRLRRKDLKQGGENVDQVNRQVAKLPMKKRVTAVTTARSRNRVKRLRRKDWKQGGKNVDQVNRQVAKLPVDLLLLQEVRKQPHEHHEHVLIVVPLEVTRVPRVLPEVQFEQPLIGALGEVQFETIREVQFETMREVQFETMREVQFETMREVQFEAIQVVKHRRKLDWGHSQIV
jgi:hypothetical protein